MKMKRAVKAAIAASMAVAVFGVGAVSFAAWTSSVETELTVTGNIGTITAATQGFKDASSWLYSGFMDGILPFDQGSEGYVATAELPTIAMGDWKQAETYITLTADSTPGGTFMYKLYTYSTTTTVGGEEGGSDTQTVPVTVTPPTQAELDTSSEWINTDNPDGISLAGIGDYNATDKTLSNVGIAVIYISTDSDQAGAAFQFTIKVSNDSTPSD